MLATLAGLLAQNTHDVPDEGVGILLIVAGVLTVVVIAVTLFLIFTRWTRGRRGTGPPREPHDRGHYGH